MKSLACNSSSQLNVTRTTHHYHACLRLHNIATRIVKLQMSNFPKERFRKIREKLKETRIPFRGNYSPAIDMCNSRIIHNFACPRNTRCLLHIWLNSPPSSHRKLCRVSKKLTRCSRRTWQMQIVLLQFIPLFTGCYSHLNTHPPFSVAGRELR